MGQGLLWGSTWGWLEAPWLGSQCQTPSHPHTIMSSHLLFPFAKSFLGHGGLVGAAFAVRGPDPALP